MKYNLSDFTWRIRRIPHMSMCIVIFNIMLLGFKFFSVMKFADLPVLLSEISYVFYLLCKSGTWSLIP